MPDVEKRKAETGVILTEILLQGTGIEMKEKKPHGAEAHQLRLHLKNHLLRRANQLGDLKQADGEREWLRKKNLKERKNEFQKMEMPQQMVHHQTGT